MGRIPMKSAFIQLTNRCSLSCKYCFYNSGLLLKPDAGKIDFLALRNFFAAIGINNAMITGGDPLNYFDFERAIALIEMLKADGTRVSVNTSLVIDDRRISRLIKASPDVISVSCDSYQRETHDAQRGGWDLTQNALTMIAEAGLPLTINCTLTAFNYGQVREIWEFFAKRRITNVNFSIAFLPRPSEQHRIFSCDNLCWGDKLKLIADLEWCAAQKSNPEKELAYVAHQARLFFGLAAETKLKAGCRMGKEYLVVTPGGDVKPCFYRDEIWGNIENPELVLERMRQLGDGETDCVGQSCSSLFVISSFWRR
jgi:MoaA/NifB/PqqE/SkfB family radical SAM enzyme